MLGMNLSKCPIHNVSILKGFDPITVKKCLKYLERLFRTNEMYERIDFFVDMIYLPLAIEG